MLLGQGALDIGAGNHMGQLGSIGNHLVMLPGRGKLHPAKTDGEEKVLQPGQDLGPRIPGWGKDHAGAVEQIILGVAEAGKLAPRHGVAAAIVPGLSLSQGVQRRANGLLYPTAVNHPCPWPEGILVLRDPGHNGRGIERHQYHIAASQIVLRQRAVNGAQQIGLQHGL